MKTVITEQKKLRDDFVNSLSIEDKVRFKEFFNIIPSDRVSSLSNKDLINLMNKYLNTLKKYDIYPLDCCNDKIDSKLVQIPLKILIEDEVGFFSFKVENTEINFPTCVNLRKLSPILEPKITSCHYFHHVTDIVPWTIKENKGIDAIITVFIDLSYYKIPTKKYLTKNLLVREDLLGQILIREKVTNNLKYISETVNDDIVIHKYETVINLFTGNFPKTNIIRYFLERPNKYKLI